MSEQEIRLTIGVPTSGQVYMRFANSLCALYSKLAAQGIVSRPGPLSVKMDSQESSVIHTNREMIAKRALEDKQTHLLFLDTDMEFQPGVVDLLFSRHQPVVAVNYLVKQDDAPPRFVAVGMNGKPTATTEQSGGIEPIIYTGFGVSLFDLRVFAQTPQPWFMPTFDADDPVFYSTEDAPFYQRVRAAGFDVYLDHDASKLVSHCGIKAWNWKQASGAQ